MAKCKSKHGLSGFNERFYNFNSAKLEEQAKELVKANKGEWKDAKYTKIALSRLGKYPALIKQRSTTARKAMASFLATLKADVDYWEQQEPGKYPYMAQVRDAVSPKIHALHNELIDNNLDYDPEDIRQRFLDIWASSAVTGKTSFYQRKDIAANFMASHFSKDTAAKYKEMDSALRNMSSNELSFGGADLFTVPSPETIPIAPKSRCPDYWETIMAAIERDLKVKDMEKIMNSPEFKARHAAIISGIRSGTPSGVAMASRAIKQQRAATAASQAAVTAALYAEQIIYNEQCFLLAGLLPIAQAKVEREQTSTGSAKSLPYAPAGAPNASLMVAGDPYGFINKLTQYESTQIFHDMRTTDISTLQPMINLYKVASDKGGAPEETPIVFGTSPGTFGELKDFLSKKDLRGFGAGIKDFTFAYEGSNPFGVKKSIKAKLTIFANNFQELLKDRGGYSYIDLALKTGVSEKKRAQIAKGKSARQEEIDRIEESLAKLDFRLKAVVGWALPHKGMPHLGARVRDAIYNSYVTLNLTPTIHEFGIDDQGRVTLTINYLAYVEDFFDQPSFNIFSSNLEAMKGIMSRKLAYKSLSKECDGKEITKLKEQDAEKISQEKADCLASLIGSLIDGEKIRFINLTREQLSTFNEEGPAFFTKGTYKVQISDDLDTSTLSSGLSAAFQKELSGADDATKASLEMSLLATDPSAEQLAFFYASDLVDSILGGIDKYLTDMPNEIKDSKSVFHTNKNITKEDRALEIRKLEQFKKRYEKLRVILGPIEINTDAAVDFLTLGDLPIAVKYFADWLTKKVSSKDTAFYTLTKFLNDFFNELIKEFLNNDRCFLYSFKQKTRMQQCSLTTYRHTDNDEITQIMTTWNKKLKKAGAAAPLSRASIDAMYAEKKPILNIAGYRNKPGGNPGITKETNYLVYFAGRTQPTELMNGKKGEDAKRGIYHYMIGRPEGIVKTINLQKTDSPGLTEVRFEQEGYDGLEQLRLVYDVGIKTYANVHAFPGTYIYVDPYGFAPNTLGADGRQFDLTKFGIGGYHMITRSEHSFGAGKAESTITAKWVAQIDRDGDRGKPSGAPDGSPSKCATMLTNRNQKAKGAGIGKEMSAWSTVKSFFSGDDGSTP